MHGFYTVDGYSNNYPLEYKHRFREVIAPEIEKNEEVRVYFDTWGNRCYLFNSITGNYMRLQKGNTLVYEGLEFDMEALRELGSAMPTGWAWNLWDTLKQKTLTGGSGCIDCKGSAVATVQRKANS